MSYEDTCEYDIGFGIFFFLVLPLCCCIASWTFGIIGLCNAPKLGTGQPLLLRGLSPSSTYDANVWLKRGNWCMCLMTLPVAIVMSEFGVTADFVYAKSGSSRRGSCAYTMTVARAVL